MKWVCALLVLAFAVSSQSAGLSNRVANTTLRLPEQPPAASDTLSNAFPGLSFMWPVGTATPPGETNRLFIVEQQGRIAVITNLANPTRTVFLDITDRAL